MSTFLGCGWIWGFAWAAGRSCADCNATHWSARRQRRFRLSHCHSKIIRLEWGRLEWPGLNPGEQHSSAGRRPGRGEMNSIAPRRATTPLLIGKQLGGTESKAGQAVFIQLDHDWGVLHKSLVNHDWEVKSSVWRENSFPIRQGKTEVIDELKNVHKTMSSLPHWRSVIYSGKHWKKICFLKKSLSNAFSTGMMWLLSGEQR